MFRSCPSSPLPLPRSRGQQPLAGWWIEIGGGGKEGGAKKGERVLHVNETNRGSLGSTATGWLDLTKCVLQTSFTPSPPPSPPQIKTLRSTFPLADTHTHEHEHVALFNAAPYRVVYTRHIPLSPRLEYFNRLYIGSMKPASGKFRVENWFARDSY